MLRPEPRIWPSPSFRWWPRAQVFPLLMRPIRPIRIFLTWLPLTSVLSVQIKRCKNSESMRIRMHFRSHTTWWRHLPCSAMLDASILRFRTGNHLGVALAVHATVVAHCPSLAKMLSTYAIHYSSTFGIASLCSKCLEHLRRSRYCNLARAKPFGSLWHIANLDQSIPKRNTRRSRSHMLSLSHPLEMVSSPKTSTILPSLVDFFLIPTDTLQDLTRGTCRFFLE